MNSGFGLVSGQNISLFVYDMNERLNISHRSRAKYLLRVMQSLVLSLGVLLALFTFWPVPEVEEGRDQIFDTRAKEAISLEMIEPTSQISKPPPPPAPIPPVEVPDDVVLEEIEMEVPSEISTNESDEITEKVEGTIDTGPAFIAQAEISPKPVRFVEPEYSKEARQKKIRARVTVEVLVDEKGQVQESRIIDRFLLGDNDEPPTPVQRLGYGLEEAAEAAAKRWRFRPARHQGRTVQTYTTLTFSFGV
jgi:protein TonB